MNGRLHGRVALITGGASGMGAAHARAFVREGARVVIADIVDDAGSALADEIGAAAAYLRLDVTRSGDWATAVAETQRIFGKLDVLVNNAGVLDGGPLGTFTEQQWARVLDINLTGPFLGMSAARAALIAARRRPARPSTEATTPCDASACPRRSPSSWSSWPPKNPATAPVRSSSSTAA
ncbi:short chain dehydrogenase [Nocardia amikacinitolerans]|nr:short chain dehydrogenase [Nocardia amikacinitolerans]